MLSQHFLGIQTHFLKDSDSFRARLVIEFDLEGMEIEIELDPFGCTFKGMVISKYYNVWLYIQRNGNGN